MEHRIKKYMERAGSISKLIVLIGVLLLIPLCVLPFYPQDMVYVWDFLIPSLCSVAFGLLLGVLKKKNVRENDFLSRMKEGSLTVLAAWGYGFLGGAMPFVLGGKLTFVQALFEAVSGWTTTGLSVMDVETVPHIFLFHRSFMQFCGGLGFVMMMVAFVQGKDSMPLYQAEGHPDKLLPNLKKTAQVIGVMYTGFLIGGTLLYRICGVGFFDGINHAMGALSTGGFSTRTDSIGAYDSLAVEFVTILLMLIGTTNFAVLLLLAKKKIRQFLQVSEERFLAGLLCVSVPLAAFCLCRGLYVGLGEGLRMALFNVVSALSTSGFSTMPYDGWPQSAVFLMVLLMLIGGGIGSTAGGMKLTRVYLALRLGLAHIRTKIYSARKVNAPSYHTAQGKVKIDWSLWNQTIGFLITYLLIYAAGTFLLTLTTDRPLGEAMFEFASSLGTVGLSIGITNPLTSNATLVVEMAGMILGRLEIFIVFVGLHSVVLSFAERRKQKRL